MFMLTALLVLATAEAAPNECSSPEDAIFCQNVHLDGLPPITDKVITAIFTDTTFGRPGKRQRLSQEFLRPYANQNLEELLIENGNIESVEPRAFERLAGRLKNLDITTKSVAQQAFSGLRLQKLRITGLDPASLSRGAFGGLERVNQLSIVESNLNDLEPFRPDLERVFVPGQPDLSFHISQNRLETLPSSFDPIFRRLKTVTLTDNPWRCDCDLAWLITRYNSMSGGFDRSSDEPVCHSPAQLRGVRFSSLVANVSSLSPFQQNLSAPLYILCPGVKLEAVQLDIQPFPETQLFQKALLVCNVTGGRDLGVRWTRESSFTMQSLNASNRWHPRELVSQFDSLLGRQVNMTGFTKVESQLLVDRQGPVDTFVCEGVDSGTGMSQSTRISIKWPPIDFVPDLPVSSTEAPMFPSKTLPSPQQGAFEKQFSLIELLGAILGTFLLTTLLFIIGSRFCLVRRKSRTGSSSCCAIIPPPGRSVPVGDKQYLSTTTGLTHSPNGTNSSNTSYGAGPPLLIDQQQVAAFLANQAPGTNFYLQQQPGTPRTGLIYQNAHNDKQAGHESNSPCAYESINTYLETYDQPKQMGQTILRPMAQLPPPPNGPPPAVPTTSPYLDHSGLFNNQMLAATLNARTVLTSQQQQQLQYMSALAAANLIATNGLAPTSVSGSQSNLLQNNR